MTLERPRQLGYGRAGFIQSFDGEKLSQELALDLRNRLFKKIENLSFSYDDTHSTGQLMIRATDDVKTEVTILDALHKLMKDRTSFVIAEG